MLEQRPWQRSSRCQEMFIFQQLVIYLSIVIFILGTKMSWFGKILITLTINTTSDCILCGDFQFLVEGLWIFGCGVLRKE